MNCDEPAGPVRPNADTMIAIGPTTCQIECAPASTTATSDTTPVACTPSPTLKNVGAFVAVKRRMLNRFVAIKPITATLKYNGKRAAGMPKYSM